MKSEKKQRNKHNKIKIVIDTEGCQRGCSEEYERNRLGDKKDEQASSYTINQSITGMKGIV